MALSIIGIASCPFCGGPSEVGRSRGGKGNSIHLICRPCYLNLQVHIMSPVAEQLARQAIGETLAPEKVSES